MRGVGPGHTPKGRLCDGTGAKWAGTPLVAGPHRQENGRVAHRYLTTPSAPIGAGYGRLALLHADRRGPVLPRGWSAHPTLRPLCGLRRRRSWRCRRPWRLVPSAWRRNARAGRVVRPIHPYAGWDLMVPPPARQPAVRRGRPEDEASAPRPQTVTGSSHCTSQVFVPAA